MSEKQLAAYAFIGAEHKRQQQLRYEKIKHVMENTTDEEYNQMLELATKLGDEQMLRDLPVMRAMVKKNEEKTQADKT